MPINYIVLAIPVFFLLIGSELLVGRLQKREYYRLDDSINNMACGIVQQFLNVLMGTTLFTGYLFLYGHYHLFSIPHSSMVAWIACYVGFDFLHYWTHRMEHQVNVLWAVHVVHHQSEELNLSIGLRVGAFDYHTWVFQLPLAILGFPPVMFLAVSSFNQLYGFLIHTRAIGKLGPLEWIFNTPSHHRVHHARNPRYLDRNYAGTFIVWDRLFGTLAMEEEEPVYGTTTPLRSCNPVWANLSHWSELVEKARKVQRFSDRLRLLVARPGWNPPELGGSGGAPEVDGASPLTSRPLPASFRGYVLAQFVPVLLATVWLLNEQSVLPLSILVGCSVLVVGTLCVVGGLLEGRSWARRFERFRVPIFALLAIAGPAGSPGAAVLALLFALGSLRWLSQATVFSET
jgi:alkylglycerol monooxygenase